MNLIQRVVRKLATLYFFDFLPDEQYLKLRFWTDANRHLNIKNPITFNEKLQWLKIHDHNPSYTTMVDKYAVREYIKEKLGEQYLIPLIGVWDNVEDIDFDKLPKQFVIKCNHDSGGLVICTDKSKLDVKQAKKKLKKCMKRKFYNITREWPYKNVERKIICEEFMSENGEAPEDFKVLCFNGTPTLIQVHRGRYNGNHTQDFYDTSWNKTPILQGIKQSDVIMEKPPMFDEMLELSAKLASGIRHVRIDWYNIHGKLYFGEITFFDGSGYYPFDNVDDDIMLGNLIIL